MSTLFFRCALASWLVLTPALSVAESIKLATWNIAWLRNEPLPDRTAVERCEAQRRVEPDGSKRAFECQGGVYRLAGSYNALSLYARHLDADIVALQEVEGEEALGRIFDPAEYLLHVSASPSIQRTGFAIRRRILAKPPVFRDVKDIGAPLVQRRRDGLEALVTLRSGKSVRLLTLHAKSFCHERPLDDPDSHCVVLAAQVPAIERWIDDAHRTGQAWFVLGDFNRVFDTEGSQAQRNGKTVNMWAEIDDDDPRGLKPRLLTRGLRHVADCQHRTPRGKSAFFIDHIIAGGGTQDRVSEAADLPYTVLRDDERARHVPRRFLSDHCAVWATWIP
jgi:endonuclease/exonuclease/phosphatase family metal-dependent hydrolase